jgi:hypothetical protein
VRACASLRSTHAGALWLLQSTHGTKASATHHTFARIRPEHSVTNVRRQVKLHHVRPCVRSWFTCCHSTFADPSALPEGCITHANNRPRGTQEQ